MIAIVGSRLCSAAGQAITRRFASDLGRAGFVVVSGLARGIDRAAHDAAIESGTVAVLAGGADVVYPPEHAALQAEIAMRGCVVTEQPPGFTPRGQDFPRRNRIISGLSLGTLVIEAARRSGSLVTARLAAEQGREVFAVPGHPLDPRAEGTNGLLKSGATLVTAAQDVINALSPVLERPPQFTETIQASRRHEPNRDALEATDSDCDAVLRCLGPAPATLDAILDCSGLTARRLQVVLIELALSGQIERSAGQLVSLSIKAR